jgi:hypothetical protein
MKKIKRTEKFEGEKLMTLAKYRKVKMRGNDNVE